MGLNVLIVDDEYLARSRMRSLLAECSAPVAASVHEADNAVQAMTALQHGQVDLVLLDIPMPGTDGLKLARQMHTLPRAPAVVFVTAHAEHALQAFELDAVDYLTKPVRLERLQQALLKVERTIQARLAQSNESLQDFLLIQDRGRTERVPLTEVIFLKAELKYVTVRTNARSFILDASLNDLEVRYGSRFLRIHRNALVSRRAIRALEKHYDAHEGEGWAVRLQGMTEVMAVSRRQVTSVRDVLAGRNGA